MTAAVLHSSARHDWQTPVDVLELVREVADDGRIALDPCTTPDNPTGAEEWIAPPDDGLAEPWTSHGLVYVNPPYGRALPLWVDHAAWSAKRCGEIVMLTPARPDTRWFRVLWHSADALCFWSGRITFVGAEHSAPFPSLVSYWGPAPYRFASVLEQRGCVQVRR